MWRAATAGLAAAAAGCQAAPVTRVTSTPSRTTSRSNASSTTTPVDTATPIEHLVVLFQENVSFDHYFGTYPHAANPAGEPAFHARPGTPAVDGLTPALRADNPNAANPQRLGRDRALTADMDHGYTGEQRAFDGGRMDRFVENAQGRPGGSEQYFRDGLVMDYYDGNTVTALWQYAQHYAMSDHSFGTVTGPSTLGALDLVAGQTHGAYAIDEVGNRLTGGIDGVVAVDARGVGTVIGDPPPAFDDVVGGPGVAMTGRNVGDLLSAWGVTWGWFQGGFRPTGHTVTGAPVCGASHRNVAGVDVTDYSPHHNPFQYYESTANPRHSPPADPDEVGHDGPANHQYDLSTFFASLDRDSLPAVSFVKAARYQDGHAGYSDPLDEQRHLVRTIDAVQSSAAWPSTAVVIAYDDSDGWYDHVFPPQVNPSHTDHDVLDAGGAPLGGYQGRYGYGPRLPLLVVSPYAKVNAVDHTVTDQSSILRFVEDNWGTGRIGDDSFDALAGPLDGLFDFSTAGGPADRLRLDPESGQPV